MNEGPDDFVFKPEHEGITPKRVGVVLDGIDKIVQNYNIKIPVGTIKIADINQYAVDTSSEEEVADQLNRRLLKFKDVISTGDLGGEYTVQNQLNDLVSDEMFIAFLLKAREIQLLKE